MNAVSVDLVSRTMQVVLERSGRQIVYDDPANGARLKVDAQAAGAPEGFLPAFIVAGETVWREAVGEDSRSTSCVIHRRFSAIAFEVSAPQLSRR